MGALASQAVLPTCGLGRIDPSCQLITMSAVAWGPNKVHLDFAADFSVHRLPPDM